MICKLCGGTTTKPRYVPNRLGEKVPLCKACFLLLETKTILTFFDASIGELLKELRNANFDFTLASFGEHLFSTSGKGD